MPADTDHACRDSWMTVKTRPFLPIISPPASVFFVRGRVRYEDQHENRLVFTCAPPARADWSENRDRANGEGMREGTGPGGCALARACVRTRVIAEKRPLSGAPAKSVSSNCATRWTPRAVRTHWSGENRRRQPPSD